jgi:oligosaccharide repeat unit polymerase
MQTTLAHARPLPRQRPGQPRPASGQYAALVLFMAVLCALGLSWEVFGELPAEMNLGLLLFLALLLVPVLSRLYSGRLDPLDPAVVFAGAYTLYSVVPTISLVLQGVPFTEQVYLRSVLVYLSGLGAFWVGFGLRRKARKASRPWLPPRLDLFKTEIAAALLVFSGLALLLFVVNTMGGWSALRSVSYAQRRVLFAQENVPWLIVTYFVNIGFLLYLHVAHAGGKRRAWIVLIGAFLVYAAILVGLGRRLPLLLGLFPLVAYYHYGIRRIPLVRATLLMVTAVLAMMVIARVRSVRADVALTDHIRENASVAWVDPGQSEFTGASFVTLTLLNAVPEQHGHRYGATYLQSLLILVPRAVYPERPEPLNVWLARTFFPRAYAKGGGYAGALVGEAYLNFSFLGPVVVLLLMGVFCAWLGRLLRTAGNSPGVVLLACNTIPWLLVAMRAPFASLLKGYMVLSFVPLVILIFLCAAPARRTARPVASVPR